MAISKMDPIRDMFIKKNPIEEVGGKKIVIIYT
jgi:hypothetical protein